MSGIHPLAAAAATPVGLVPRLTLNQEFTDLLDSSVIVLVLIHRCLNDEIAVVNKINFC